MDHMDIVNGYGILKDQIIKLRIKGSKEGLELRLVTYKDPSLVNYSVF